MNCTPPDSIYIWASNLNGDSPYFSLSLLSPLSMSSPGPYRLQVSLWSWFRNSQIQALSYLLNHTTLASREPGRPAGGASRAGRNAQWGNGGPCPSWSFRRSPSARRVSAALAAHTIPCSSPASLCPASPRSLSRATDDHTQKNNTHNNSAQSLPTLTSQHFPQTLHWYPPCSDAFNGWLSFKFFLFWVSSGAWRERRGEERRGGSRSRITSNGGLAAAIVLWPQSNRLHCYHRCFLLHHPCCKSPVITCIWGVVFGGRQGKHGVDCKVACVLWFGGCRYFR